jgi:NAD(P)-dependent dehydrogenase (short-subunit alcohol dehydrogenase family)
MTLLDRFSLTGKVAVVTGGRTGIGASLAQALADVGAHVVIAARDVDACHAAAAAITAAGGSAVAVALDVTDRAQIETLVADVTRRLGPIDILVNNAGVCFHRDAIDVPDDEWHAVFDVNVNGLWYCSQIVGRTMIERKTGTIINIGSMSAFIVNRPQFQPAYNASKAAVHHLTRSLAAEWAPYNVRVNAIAPGYIATAMSPVDDPKFHRYWIEDTPMQRPGTPDELGPTVVYLASAASSFVTGAVIVADGGYSLW